MKPVPHLLRKLQQCVSENIMEGASFLVRKDNDDDACPTSVQFVGKVFAPSTRLKATFTTHKTTGDAFCKVTSTKGTFDAEFSHHCSWAESEVDFPALAEIFLSCGRTFTVATPTLETVCLVTVYKDGLKYHPVEEKYE